jgi:hypothetical protein
MMNVAFSSLRNLQSSLNHEDGVGLYSLTGSCGAFTFMSLFTPSLIQQFRPKRCLLFALFTHLLYVAANVILFSILLVCLRTTDEIKFPTTTDNWKKQKNTPKYLPAISTVRLSFLMAVDLARYVT